MHLVHGQHRRCSAACSSHIPVDSRFFLCYTIQLQHPNAEETQVANQHPTVDSASIVSNMFFPLVATTPPWVIIEIFILSPVGALYSSFLYQKAVLHMGTHRHRMRRVL